MATRQSVTIYRGGSYVLEIELLDADGDPLDPTGLDLRYRIGKHMSRKIPPILSFDTADLDVSQIDGAWVAAVPLTTGRTKTLKAPRYYHELYLEDEGQRFVLMQGTVNVAPARAAHE